PQVFAGGVRSSEIARRLRVTGYPEDQITETPKLEDIMTLIEQSSSQHAYILATYTAMLEFRDLLAQRQAVGKEMK
ncbi:MurT ligase domain-containing protein, partial [Streptococcus suis]